MALWDCDSKPSKRTEAQKLFVPKLLALKPADKAPSHGVCPVAHLSLCPQLGIRSRSPGSDATADRLRVGGGSSVGCW